MALQDIKVRFLQAIGIYSPDDDTISVKNKMEYLELFPIENDGDIVHKAYIDGIIGRDPITFTSDSLGEYDFTSEDLPEYPGVTLYENGQTIPATFDNTTKKLIFLNPSTEYTVKFS